MGYDYLKERPALFTEDGVKKLMKVRDQVAQLIHLAGAFRVDKISATGDSWTTLACLDYLVEIGELEEWNRPSWAQFKVYSTPKTHNL